MLPKRLIAFLALLPLIVCTGCGCTTVKPGWVGIRVNMYGSQRGVEDLPIVTGRVWYNAWTEDVYEFPTFMQTVTWTKSPHEGKAVDESISFNSVEGASVNSDVSLAYAIKAEKVPNVFVKFRQTVDYITDTYMRGKVRDALNTAAGQMKVTDIMGAKKGELLAAAKKALVAELEPQGFAIDMLSFVSDLRPDEKVKESINKTIEATQKAIEAENKVKESEAIAKQEIAASDGKAQAILKVATAQAEANKQLGSSLTPEVILFQAMQKWDGAMPAVLGAGATPLLQMPTLTPKRLAADTK